MYLKGKRKLKGIVLCLLLVVLCIQSVSAYDFVLDDHRTVESQIPKEMLKALRVKKVELSSGHVVKASAIRGVQQIQFNIKGSSYQWKSSNPKIATVSTKGKVKLLKAGTTKITAKKNGKTYACKLTVEVPQITPASMRIPVGTITSVKLRGTCQAVRYSSSNPDIVYVYSNGFIKAKKNGTAYVYATVGVIKTYTCKVRVAPNPAPVTVITPAPTPVPPQQQVTYVYNYESGICHNPNCASLNHSNLHDSSKWKWTTVPIGRPCKVCKPW
ncbi:MAG: Ig-like domain-containing protein [Blautia sp.]|nr:Ig-like domain-containing protein [Blautia sp.]